jgi:molybdopterin synthase sulfur carrier subunit
MKIQVFALLKDHFEKEFEVKEQFTDVASLKNYLSNLKPSAANILEKCRFAVHDEFINHDFQLTEHDTVCIIPPSSGG